MITISAAKKDDGPAIVQLEQTVWQEENISNVYDIASFIRHGFVYVAKEKGSIIGVLVSFITKQGEIYISNLVVHPDYRNKHIATRLYQRLLRDTNLPLITFISPDYHASLHLHERLGFKKLYTARKPYSQQLDPFFMYRLER